MALKFHRELLGLAFSHIYLNGLPMAISNTLLKHFPVMVTTLHKWFPISSQFITFAACPRCCQLYAPQNGVYPVTCTWDDFEVAKSKQKQYLVDLESKNGASHPKNSGKKTRKDGHHN